jgi:hypothetical protein
MNPFLFLEYLTTRLPYISFVQSMYILNIQCSYKTIVKKISFSWIWSRFGVVQKISPSVIIPLLPCEISWFECECLSVPQKSLLLSWVYYNNFLLNSWRHAFFTDFLGPQEGFEDTKGVIRICKSKNRQHKKTQVEWRQIQLIIPNRCFAILTCFESMSRDRFFHYVVQSIPYIWFIGIEAFFSFYARNFFC